MATRRADYRLGDAVALAHAVARQVGQGLGTRVLVIKGPSAEHHALRVAHVSSDADIWVEPSGVDPFIHALARSGWTERQGSELGHELVTHSVAMCHAQWPCDIDTHRTFPGFLADPGVAFEALWERRELLTLAGIDIEIPDRCSTALIMALHALRTPAQTARHGRELRHLVDTVGTFDVATKHDLLELALRTGATDTARPFLRTLGIALPAAVPYGHDPMLDAWRARVAADGVIGAQVWIAVSRRPWRERPHALARALWTSERDLRANHPDVRPGWWPLTTARLSRIVRGARQLPRIWRARRLARRGATVTSLLPEGDR